MDTCPCRMYIMGYETTRKSQAVGTASSTSHCHAACGQNLPLGCADVEILPEFGGALVSGLSKERPTGNTEPGKMGTALTLDRTAERKAETDAVAGSCGSRTRHRPVDAETDCTADKGQLWRPVYARRRMEALTQRFRLELSKASATSSAKERKGHSIVEAQDMAFFKKKPESLMLTSPSWTRADFCSYPTSGRPGLRQATLRSFATATGATKSRPSGASPYPRAAVVWVFMSVSMRTISPARKSSHSCGICCAICASMFFWSGTTAPSIKGQMSKRFFKRPGGFISTGSPATRRNSILLNTFGHMANAIFPTACTRTRIIWGRICIVLSAGFEILRHSLNRVSNSRKFPGHDKLVSIIC
jgi:hypothetical protein